MEEIPLWLTATYCDSFVSFHFKYHLNFLGELYTVYTVCHMFCPLSKTSFRQEHQLKRSKITLRFFALRHVLLVRMHTNVFTVTIKTCLNNNHYKEKYYDISLSFANNLPYIG